MEYKKTNRRYGIRGGFASCQIIWRGTREFLFDEQTGLRVKPNTRSIVKALERIINQPDLAEAYSLQARDRIEIFDWDILASQILEYFQPGFRKPDVVKLIEG